MPGSLLTPALAPRPTVFQKPPTLFVALPAALLVLLKPPTIGGKPRAAPLAPFAPLAALPPRPSNARPLAIGPIFGSFFSALPRPRIPAPSAAIWATPESVTAFNRPAIAFASAPIIGANASTTGIIGFNTASTRRRNGGISFTSGGRIR